MLLYHGSKKELGTIKNSQAQMPEGHTVPQEELLDAIYLTSDMKFAVAMAARPEGTTHLGEKDGKSYIEFEHPDMFDPAREVFVYEIDTAKIPQENIRQIDDHQWVVEGLAEIKPDSMQRLRAGKVFEYYELRPWRMEGGEAERKVKFK